MRGLLPSHGCGAGSVPACVFSVHTAGFSLGLQQAKLSPALWLPNQSALPSSMLRGGFQHPLSHPARGLCPWEAVNSWEPCRAEEGHSQDILSSVQSLSHVQLSVTPWTAACQAPLSIANPWIITHQAPMSMGFSRQEDWGGLPYPTPLRGSS